jgi:hypothetical protein
MQTFIFKRTSWDMAQRALTLTRRCINERLSFNLINVLSIEKKEQKTSHRAAVKLMVAWLGKIYSTYELIFIFFDTYALSGIEAPINRIRRPLHIDVPVSVPCHHYLSFLKYFIICWYLFGKWGFNVIKASKPFVLVGRLEGTCSVYNDSFKLSINCH